MIASRMTSNPVRYVMFFVPRSGSTLLCNLLENAGYGGAYDGDRQDVIGRYERLRVARQYARELERIDWEEKDLGCFFRGVFASTENHRGVQGFKVFFRDLELLASIISKSSRYRRVNAYNLVGYFPRGVNYVYLRRRNRVRQAISHARALKERRWCRATQVPREKPPIGLSDVLGAYANIRLIERETARLLRRNGIRPLRLTFEELMKDKKAAVLKVVRHLGFRPRDVPLKEDLKKQSDSYSDRLYRCYSLIIPLRWRWMRLWEVLFAWSARLKDRSPAYASTVRFVKRLFGVRPR